MQTMKLITKFKKIEIVNETTDLYKQNPVCNGYFTVSELNDVLPSGYYESFLGYNYVDWLMLEAIKLENGMAFYL